MQLSVCVSQTWNALPISPEEQVKISLARLPEGLEVKVATPFYADPAPPFPVGPSDGLWDYEVVELFLVHGEQYTELELGPHGHYLLLRLDGIRQAFARALPLTYHWEITVKRWWGETLIPWEYLPPEPWTFNAYAIHGCGEQRRYLALFAVPGAEPDAEADFHRLPFFQPLVWEPL